MIATPVSAQAPQQGKTKKSKKDTAQVALVPHEVAKLFRADSPLTLTLTANMRQLRRDKDANVPWRAAQVSYVDSSGSTVAVPVRVRTRGIWRLKNCEFPPLRLNFAKDSAKHTVFAGLDKPKLVTHCRDTDEYETWLLQEFQLYRVYNLLTPFSNRVRLARVTYVDSASGKTVATRYAILQEDPGELASRLGGIPIEQKGAGPDDLSQQHAALFAVFQYLIGNTDWSISGLHNVELVGMDTAVVPVAYDFDYAGAVNTRYAAPDPRLPIRRVRDRLFRGYCLTTATYEPVFELFRARKDSIYALYRDALGQLLPKRAIEDTLSYFDDFYETLSDPRRIKREIMENCIPRR
jgi:hypothetical protein